MPGQPITAAAIQRLEAYGLERILDRVIDGDHLSVIASDPHINVSRPMLSRWINGRIDSQGGDPGKERGAQRRALYLEARALSAQSLVEDGMRDLERETDPKAAHLAKSKAEFRLRLAENYDRENFGARRKDTNVNVNVGLGQLHLDALRRRVSATVAPPVPESTTSPDYEVAP